MTIDKNNSLHLAVLYWLPVAAAIVVLSSLIYVAVQQSYRQSANDPQIQIAEDLSQAISSGSTPPDAIVSPNPTQDLTTTLATFVAIYDATGTPVGSLVALDGKLPNLPAGVLDYVKLHGEDRFTWQPKPGVRIAAVVSHFSGPVPGFVLAGRSLKEVEVRINNLTKMTALATGLALVLTFLLVLLSVKMLASQNVNNAEMAEDKLGNSAI